MSSATSSLVQCYVTTVVPPNQQYRPARRPVSIASRTVSAGEMSSTTRAANSVDRRGEQCWSVMRAVPYSEPSVARHQGTGAHGPRDECGAGNLLVSTVSSAMCA